jgi:very-short-patch-repair endonuclease
MPSYLEEQFERSIQRNGLPEPVREYSFQCWRFDFAWPKLLVAVEVDGGTFNGGNHVRGLGYQRDCMKHNAAQLQGWAVLRADREMVGSNEFADIVKKMLLVRVSWLRKTGQQRLLITKLT